MSETTDPALMSPDWRAVPVGRSRDLAPRPLTLIVVAPVLLAAILTRTSKPGLRLVGAGVSVTTSALAAPVSWAHAKAPCCTVGMTCGSFGAMKGAVESWLIWPDVSCVAP